MMRLKHILGPSIYKNEARILRALRSPRFHGFIFLNGALMMLLNPSPTIAAAPLHLVVAIWGFGSALFVPVYCMWEFVFLRLWLRPGRTDVPEILIMCLTLAVLVPLVIGFAAMIGVWITDPYEIAGVIVFTLLMLQGSSYITLRFVDRLLFPELYLSTPDGKDPKTAIERPIFIQGTTIPLVQVEMIVARDHQTEVIARAETQISRLRFGDLVAELPVESGFQIHRSIWVSRDLAVRVVRDGRRAFVEVSPGRRLPVARERLREFEHWLRVQPTLRKSRAA
ncbi:MAG: hypothetical protein CFE34_06975 [Rhodobacteraceae bacterium PARR1]|nr:MAG: hypothetical protein CFE34_06975 [Rhodobacteraceae bacterium PARR1]